MSQTMNEGVLTSRAHSIVIVGDPTRCADRLDEVYDKAVALGPEKLIERLRQRIAERDGQVLMRAAEAIESNLELHGALLQLSVKDGTLACQAFIDEQHEDELIRALRSIRGVPKIEIRVIH